MTTKDDGGPAFPQFYTNDLPPMRGMTLRDYFAAHSMITAAISILGLQMENKATPGVDAVAAKAYELADAMLAARNAQ